MDQGAFISVSNKPPGVIDVEALSDTLRAEAAQLSHRLGSSSGAGLLRGIVSQDPFAIMSQIKTALTDTSLVHSHYYQSAEVRQLVAGLIARK